MTSGWGDERDPELLEKNPHRVFAEDVVRSLGLYFGDENVTYECLSKSISASTFLGTPEAEETAATMARMFSHRRRALNELNLEAAASLSSAIEAYRTNGHVQNDTWVISLSKAPCPSASSIRGVQAGTERRIDVASPQILLRVRETVATRPSSGVQSVRVLNPPNSPRPRRTGASGSGTGRWPLHQQELLGLVHEPELVRHHERGDRAR